MRKVGIVSISDERPNANERIAPIIQAQKEKIIGIVGEMEGVDAVVIDTPINTPSAARDAGSRLAAEKVVATIFNLPTFGFPKFGVLISMFAPGPYMLVAQMDYRQPSPAGITGLGGAMTQLGVPHERLWDDLGKPSAKRRIEVFISAASAVNALKGQVLGLIGGRSMGLYPMVASSKDVTRTFGVDVDHIDQIEIVRRAKEVPEERVRKALSWLSENASSIQFDNVLTLEKLKQQIRDYESLKTIAREKEMDFMAVKCHYEMSEFQQPLCIAAMFSNDPYDWDGDKQPTVFACEADEDGALTMQILKLVSSGKPTCLLDMRFYHEESDTYLLQNCGTAPSWFACRSCNAKQNLGKVDFTSCVPKFRGGGAQASFWFAQGTYTLARLYQGSDGYHLLISPGTAVGKETVPTLPHGEAHWPKMAMKIKAGPERLVQMMNCVHLHAVEGDYTEELKLICKYLKVTAEVIGDETRDERRRLQ